MKLYFIAYIKIFIQCFLRIKEEDFYGISILRRSCLSNLLTKETTFILTKNECNHMRETASKPSMAKYLGKLILFIFKLTYVLERKGVYMWLGNLS